MGCDQDEQPLPERKLQSPPLPFPPKNYEQQERHWNESFEPLMSEIKLQLITLVLKTRPGPERKAFLELSRIVDRDTYSAGLRQIQDFILSYRNPILEDLAHSQGYPGSFRLEPASYIWQIPAFMDEGIYIDQEYAKEQIKLRESNQCNVDDIWSRKEVVDWSSSTESSILFISGTSKSRHRLEKFSVELVDHFASNDYTTLHLLNPLPDEVNERMDGLYGIDILRQLAIQSLRQPVRSRERSYLHTTLAEVTRNFKAAFHSGWFDCLAHVMEYHERVAIVIHEGVFRDMYENGHRWPDGLLKLIQKLQGKTLVKFIMVGDNTIEIQRDYDDDDEKEEKKEKKEDSIIKTIMVKT
ncbi:hypothetical protein NM208_g4622 [Fusarium decemcellulare]|uniref:Uncharacterized protein n=1 Tax=Fusarium decemcellulare TaxID=57161 RepID=A0ACC1SK53_9HYPO|nr:hypothetical protein NM208_g4622 [Fusarium decemcellulare]